MLPELLKHFGVTYLLLISFVSILLLSFMKWRHGRRHMYELAAKISEPENLSKLPIIGHAHHFIGDTERILNKLNQFGEAHSPATVWLANRLFFTIGRPEDLELVLNSPHCLEKDDLYKFSLPLVGKGLFGADVPTWKRHRKLIAPAFNQKILDGFVELFSIQTKILNELLEAEVGKTIDVLDFVSKWSLDVICETAMGVKINAQTSENKYGQLIHRELEIMMTRMFNVPFHFDFIFNLTNLAKEEKEIVQEYHNFTRQVVADKKNEFKLRQSESHEAEFGTLKRKAFLDHLIELSETGGNFSDQELEDEVNTLVIAGSDTIATSLSFTLLMLAMHKDIEQKIYEEIMEVLGAERYPDCSDLPKFKYAEKVIKETMRLFPVGPTIVRKVTDDLKLENCTIPKGAGLVLMIGPMQRSPKYYDDPLRFDPERFNADETIKRHPYAYLPFSAGPRNCIGIKYGYMVMKIFLACLVRKYKLETTYEKIEDIRLKQSLVLKSVLGFPIKLTLRNKYK